METIRSRFQWTHELVLEFIDMVGDNHLELNTGIKKCVYTRIAEQINKDHEMDLTWDQCENKWKALTRQYNVVKVHNNTPGKKPKEWRYFDNIEKVLNLSPEIEVEDTDSEALGTTDVSDPDTLEHGANLRLPVNVPTSVDGRNPKRSRYDIEQENTENYRKAKLQIMERFTIAFEKLIEHLTTKY